MRFNNWKEMYDTLGSGLDLYNEENGLYVFSYNDAGALCYYELDSAEAKKIACMAVENDEYWGAFLGCGGHILDNSEYDKYRYTQNELNHALYLQPSIDFCKEHFSCDGWEFTKEWQKRVALSGVNDTERTLGKSERS